MGMTIDAIEQWAEENNYVIVSSEMWAIAQKTMRKYQKIQEIVSSKTTRLSYEDGFRQIKEVLEDGECK